MKGVWQRGMTQLPLMIKKTSNISVAATSDNRQRYDKMARFIVREINTKQADSLYLQLDKAFKGQMPKEQFVQIFNRLTDQIGLLDSITYLEQYKEAAVYNTSSPSGKWQLLLALSNKDSITGLFIRPAQEHSSTNRPQTPKPPYTYNSDDIEFDNADRSIHFGGTFTYPKTGSNFITALMITGSGQQDRDETLFGHKPFAVIADYLTKNGYAVLRIDDRGVGKTTGAGTLDTATSADFAKDIEAAVTYLRTRKDVSKIGLIGHSEGGFIAPMVAAKDSKIAFIISLAGTGMQGDKIYIYQNTDYLKKVPGVSTFAFNEWKSLMHDNPNYVIIHRAYDTKKMYDGLVEIYKEWKIKAPDSIKTQLVLTDEKYSALIQRTTLPWMRYFISTNPARFWKQVKCPVLALNGEKDIQVYARENTEDMQKSLFAGGNKKITLKIFPGLNHLFQKCNSCSSIAEYGELEETFSPDVLTVMLEWLNKNFN